MTTIQGGRFCVGHDPIVISFENGSAGYETFYDCWKAMGRFLKGSCSTDAMPHYAGVSWMDFDITGYVGTLVVDGGSITADWRER